MEVYGDLAQKSQELSDQLENTRDFLNFQVKNAGFYAFLLWPPGSWICKKHVGENVAGFNSRTLDMSR